MDDDKIIITMPCETEIISSLLNFCDQNKIDSAWISGIGAIKSATLLNYDLETKKYSSNNIGGKLEIANLTGNISVLNNKKIAHIHCVLADETMKTYGGHLEKAVVSVTCEILINKIKKPIKRSFDEFTGLNLIQT